MAQTKLLQTKLNGTEIASNKNPLLILEGDNAKWFPLLDEVLDRHFRRKAKLVYLDPPYNTRRYRGARRRFRDRNPRWTETIRTVIEKAHACLADNGFLAISINRMELFNLKNIADEFFPNSCFVGLFPIKIRHFLRQLMINATYHDVYEYLLIFRKNPSTRFNSKFIPPRIEKFKYQIETSGVPERRVLGGKEVEIYRPSQYRIIEVKPSQNTFRRYIIAGKVATANWSGEFYENHLRALGTDLLVKVHGLEKQGLGYRWFLTSNHDRQSGIYFQSMRTAGRLGLFSNDVDYTEVVPTIYREGGEGCDFKDSKKPEALLNLLMDMTTKEGDLVLDFYGGSGTTLAVAIKKNRACLIIEKNDFVLRVIRNRLRNLQNGLDLDGKAYKFTYSISSSPEEWTRAERRTSVAQKVLANNP
jgi:adenine-specific DNA-methyltransferase